MKTTRDSKTVFLRAAKWIDVGRRHLQGACIAVSIADRSNDWHDGSKEVSNFQDIFKPDGRPSFLYWMDDGSQNLKQHRVIALLLAHAMRQTGDL